MNLTNGNTALSDNTSSAPRVHIMPWVGLKKPTSNNRSKVLLRKEAWRIVGGLSAPTKMPGACWGLPASTCKRGSRLRQIEGSICSQCYARGVAYRRGHVVRAQERRYQRMNHPRWTDAMVRLLRKQTWFRWYDTGDVQNVDQLIKIASVCRRTPRCKHWLSTREIGMVREFLKDKDIPSNLNIRLSVDFIDTPPGPETRIPGCTTSTVSTAPGLDGYDCPVTNAENGPKTCNEAKFRECWSKSVQNVSYGLH